MRAIYPVTITNKLEENKQFYCDLFDFEPVFEADWYVQLLHKESGVELAFMLPNLDNQPAVLHAPFAGNGVIYSIEVDDAAAEYARILEKGVPVVYPLASEEWGQSHFMLRDPSGAYVDIVQQAK